MSVLRQRRSKRQYVRCTYCTPVDRREQLEAMWTDYDDLLKDLEAGRTHEAYLDFVKKRRRYRGSSFARLGPEETSIDPHWDEWFED